MPSDKQAATPRFAIRGRHLFVYDLAVTGLSILGAFALRFDASDVLASMRPYLPVALLPLAIQPIVNVMFGLYRREWRYASVRELLGIAAAVGTGSVLAAATFLILAAVDAPGTSGMPRSFFPLMAMLNLLLIGGGRFAIRSMLEAVRPNGASDRESREVRTLVYGAGEAGAAIARLARHDRTVQVKVVGFLDDDAAKRGSQMLGAKIYGGCDCISLCLR